MWPGMRPATGWIAYFTVPPRFSTRSAELAHLVLCLRHCHAVAGHDDHLLRVGDLNREVLRRDRLHGQTGCAPGAARRRRAAPKAPNRTFASDRFIALHMIWLRMMPELIRPAHPR